VLDVRASRLDGALVVSVSDNGVGQDMTSLKRTAGIGLANTRARLAHLYGRAHSLDVQSAPGQGFTVTITIPYHTEAIAPNRMREDVREAARSGAESRTEER
jgi:signal transduction histidine kinase